MIKKTMVKGRMEDAKGAALAVIMAIDKKNQEMIYNSDKSYAHWKLKDGENFSKVFYHKQKECPKTPDGKLICMKFFLRGLCDRSCNRAHALSKDDSKKFEKFVMDCCEGASKLGVCLSIHPLPL